MKYKMACLSMAFLWTAQAAEIQVDDQVCLLSDALVAAMDNVATGGCQAGAPGEDVIVLPENHTFTLSTPFSQNTIAALQINQGKIIIEGNGSILTRDPNTPELAILSLRFNADVTIRNLTISAGHNPYNSGGGIMVGSNNARLELDHVNVLANEGGGIFFANLIPNGMHHVIRNSRIAENTTLPGAIYSPDGAGISAVYTSILIENTTFDHNESAGSGGAIYFYESELMLRNVTMSNNTALDRGGAVMMGSDNNLFSMVNTTVVNNVAMSGGGGLDFSMRGVTPANTYISLFDSMVAGNLGGAGSNEILGTHGGALTLDGYNLIGANGQTGVADVSLGQTDFTPAEVLAQIVLPLSSDLDYKKVHGLVDGSPAIDATSNVCASDKDQLGQLRGIDGNGDGIGACDPGAVEKVQDLIFVDGFE